MAYTSDGNQHQMAREICEDVLRKLESYQSQHILAAKDEPFELAVKKEVELCITRLQGIESQSRFQSGTHSAFYDQENAPIDGDDDGFETVTRKR